MFAATFKRSRKFLSSTFYASRKQFAEQYLAAKKQLHYHRLWRSKYPNFCDHTIKEPRISLTRRGKLNFLLQAFRKITPNSASCTRKSFFLSSSHAPPRYLPSLLTLPPPLPPSLPPRPSEAREENGLGAKYEVTHRKLHVRLLPEVGSRRCGGTNYCL